MLENPQKNDSGTMNREDLIQAYIHGRLDTKMQAEFDELYKNDDGFREEVLFYKDLNVAFSSLNQKEIKAKLREFEKELDPDETSNVYEKPEKLKNKSLKKWIAAACLVIVVGLSLTLIFEKPGADEIYFAHFEPYPNIVSPITRGESEEDLLQQTFLAYKNGAYEKSAAGFKSLFESTQKSYFLLYEANSYLANDDPEKAIPLLEKQISFGDEFTEKSKWYLALAYLKTGKPDKSKKLFSEIIQAKSYKAEEAKEIIDKLD